MTPYVPPTVPRGEDDDDFHNKQGLDVTAFKNYFLLLALLVVLLALVFWLIHRRKVRKRRSRQHALARDVEAWSSTRRPIHGRYRTDNSVYLLCQMERLNEHGEAPPPYQPKIEATTMHVTIPLRTLAMDKSDRLQLPKYCDTEYMSLTPSMKEEAAHPREERGAKA